jgi:hypothetical protein
MILKPEVMAHMRRIYPVVALLRIRVEEVVQLIQEAVELHLQTLQEENLPISDPSTTLDYIETR